MSNDKEGIRPATANKRKWNEADRKLKRSGKRRKEAKENGGKVLTGEVMNVDQLAWKKISLENDEFDDFEEIEGVDVEYVDKDGNKVIQFKVINSLGHLILRLSNRRKSQNSERRSSLRRRKFQMTSGRELPTLRRISTHKTSLMEINSRALRSCNQILIFQVGQK